MPIGLELLGGEGQINTVLIIPFLDAPSKYYLFTSKGLTFSSPGENGKNFQYCFSIVDMQLNGGLGDVINKNTFIKFLQTKK